jgi:hypothetical protein
MSEYFDNITITQLISVFMLKPFSFIFQLVLVNDLSKKFQNTNKVLVTSSLAMFIFVLVNIFLYFLYVLGAMYDGSIVLGFPFIYYFSCGFVIFGSICRNMDFQFKIFLLDMLIWVTTITLVLMFLRRIKLRKT